MYCMGHKKCIATLESVCENVLYNGAEIREMRTTIIDGFKRCLVN